MKLISNVQVEGTKNTFTHEFVTIHDVPVSPKHIRYVYLIQVDDKPVEIDSTWSINDAIYEIFFAGKDEKYFGKPGVDFRILSVIESDDREVLDAMVKRVIRNWELYYIKNAEKIKDVRLRKKKSRKLTPEQEMYILKMFQGGMTHEQICNFYDISGNHFRELIHHKGATRSIPVTERPPVYQILSDHDKNHKA